jgi:hypothetical protein
MSANRNEHLLGKTVKKISYLMSLSRLLWRRQVKRVDCESHSVTYFSLKWTIVFLAILLLKKYPEY